MDLSLGDETDLTRRYAEKAFWFLHGWNDVVNAEKMINKGLESKHAKDFFFDWYLFQAYLMMGEYEKAFSVAKGPLARIFGKLDGVVNAFVYHAKRDYNAAIREFQEKARPGAIFHQAQRGYDLARCYLETGQSERAIAAIRSIQKTHPVHFARDLGDRAAIYPKTFYLLGKIYEKKGDKILVIENYEKFLTLWKDADKDLPELIEAKARLAKLRGAKREE
jgi:tetratricopeptide (TPR) repeat protein